MRLKLKNEKNKIASFGFFISSFIALAFLCLVRINVYAADGGTAEFIYTKYPLPVGPGWGYGGQLTSEIVSDMISEALVLYPDMEMLCVPMVWDSNEMTVNIYTSLTSVNFSGDIDDLDNPSSLTYSGTGESRSYRVNLSGYTDIPYSLNTGACVPSNYVTTGPSGGNAYLIDNVFIPYYPLYISSDVDPSIYNRYFMLGTGGGGDSSSITITGHSLGGGTVDFDSFTFDSNGNISGMSGGIELGLEVALDLSGIDGKLDTIAGNQEGIKESLEAGVYALSGKADSTNGKLDTVNGKLDTINGKLTDSTDGKSWLEKIYGLLEENFSVPSFDDLDEELDDTPLSDILEIPSESAQTFVDMFNAEAKTSSQMSDIVYDFEWDTTNLNDSNYSFFHIFQTIHFSFAWYESIRSKFLTVLFTFIYATVIVYTIKKVPQIINGASGVVGTGDSVSDQNNKKGGSK